MIEPAPKPVTTSALAERAASRSRRPTGRARAAVRARVRPAVLPRVRRRAAASSPGALAAMRRRWIARIGWYPGDWVWVVARDARRRGGRRSRRDRRSASTGADAHQAFEAAAAAIPVRDAGARCRQRATARRDRHLARSRPRPSRSAGAAERPTSGRRTRPAGRSSSSPTRRRSAIRRRSTTATQAAKAGLAQVGIVDSSRLREPPARVLRRLHRHLRLAGGRRRRRRTARQAGFAGAYSREIAR